jgi:hypothetical protein
MLSMGSDPRLYKEGLFVASGLENWNWMFRSCKIHRTKRMGIQRSKRIESVGNSYRKLVVEEELEASL